MVAPLSSSSVLYPTSNFHMPVAHLSVPSRSLGRSPFQSQSRLNNYLYSSLSPQKSLFSSKAEVSSEVQKAAAVASAQGAVVKSDSKDAKKNEKKQKPDFKRLAVLAKDEVPLIAFGTTCLMVAAGISMYVPTGFGHIIDIVTGSESETTLNEYAIDLAVLLGVGTIATFGRVYSFNLSGHRLIARLRKRLFESVIAKDIEFFDTHKTGDLVNRLSSDVVVMSKCLTGTQLSSGLRSVAQGVAGFGYMLYLSPALSGAVVAVVPVVATGAYFYGKFVKKLANDVQSALGESTAVAEERLSSMKTVRAFSQETKEIALYDKQVDNVFELAKKESLANGLFFSSAGFSGSLSMLGVLMYGGHLVMHGELTAGVLTSFLMYTFYTAATLLSLSSFYGELMKGLGASTRIFDLLDSKPRVDQNSGNTLPSLEGAIEYRGLDFRYPTRPGVQVLQSLDLRIDAGNVVAVVGPSGSGKSTLAALLLRLYEPEKGSVFLDGVDISSLSPSWLRKSIGIVSQEPMLFATTIKENIAYGLADREATMDEIIAAAKEANAHDFITRFPDGYDTVVGARGMSLSGGQKQRIAIARAILKDPRILILDEATSALDAESEKLVQSALEKLMAGRTVIVIAHRLSTIKLADSIVVLEHGAVAERGTHAELMDVEDGVYRNLMNLQVHGLVAGEKHTVVKR